MKYYKIFSVDEKGILRSYVVEKYLSKTYKKNVWNHAKKELWDAGYGLAVFDRLNVPDITQNFYDSDYQVWEVEIGKAEEPQTSITLQYASINSLEQLKEDLESSARYRWPDRTILTDKVKLVRQVTEDEFRRATL